MLAKAIWQVLLQSEGLLKNELQITAPCAIIQNKQSHYLTSCFFLPQQSDGSQ